MQRALRVNGVEAGLRLSAFLVAALCRHALGRVADIPRSQERRRECRTARLDVTGVRLVAVLGALKGAFVKAGQFASVRHDLVPERASAALLDLRSRVPALAFPVIRETVEAELSGTLADLFTAFDETPLGAASVAQVHRARLPNGEEVAVKVQYPWVAASLRSDLAWLRRALDLGSWWLGRAIPDRGRLLQEFGDGLREELDFEREGQIAREIAENLAGDEQIAVPRIVPSHSSRRVLTMTYCDVVPINDREALARLGTTPGAVLHVLARAYAKQVFADGVFHADPHPGNLFVVDEPTAAEKPRVLFVDFGLSQRLSPELRRDLRHGIYALLQSDLDAFVERMDAMGMIAPGAHAGVRDAVAAMFARLREVGGGLALPGSAVLGLKDEARTLLRETPGLQLPNDLLLYARTLTYLFALGEELDPSVDLVKLSTPYLLRFLAESD